jgi:hypothetical protein
MIWISLILGLIQAIPEIIDLIKRIIDAIHGHPLQAMHEHAFLGIVRAWGDHKDADKVKADLSALHSTLKP